MAGIPDTISYIWTPNDFTDAHSDRRMVTPYEIPPSLIPAVKQIQPGSLVPLPIGRLSMQLSVSRFALGPDFKWEDVPPSAASANTLADLCAALKRTKSPKYVDRYYDIAPMSAPDKLNLARLLFDYWENTEYRYALIMSGDFNWTYFDIKNDPLSHVKTKGSYTNADKAVIERRIQKVPIFKARTGSGALAPAPAPRRAQTIVLPDPALSRLDPDIHEIREAAHRIMDLLKKSEEAMKQRVGLARTVTALRVLLEQSAASSSEAENTLKMAAVARDLEKRVNEAMRTKKAAELFPEEGLSPSLVGVLRKELGYVDDMAAEIDTLVSGLCHKLVADQGFRGRCASFARDVFDKNLIHTAAYLEKRDSLIMALVDAMNALLEGAAPADYDPKINAVLKRVAEKPATKASDVKDATALDAIFSLVGTNQAVAGLAQVATASVGNLAGPPSLWIAVVQWRAWRALTSTLARSSGSPTIRSDLRRLLDETLSEMERGIPPTKAVRTEFRRVVEERDQAGLLRIKKEVLDEYTGMRQASGPWKVGILGLQALALLMSFDSAQSDFAPGKDKGNDHIVQMADILGIGSQVAQVEVAALDVALTALTSDIGKKATCYAALRLPFGGIARAAIEAESTATTLARVGVRVGAVTAFLGAIASGIQTLQAGSAGDTVKFISSFTGLVGNMLIICSCTRWLATIAAPVPGLQAVGMGLIALSTLIPLLIEAYRVSIPGPNRVSVALLDKIWRNPFALLLSSDPWFKNSMEALKIGCTFDPLEPKTTLHKVRNNAFAIQPLVDAGLGPHLALLLEESGAPLTPNR